jgi:hypothetical protein
MACIFSLTAASRSLTAGGGRLTGRWVSWTANLKLSRRALIAMAAGIPLTIAHSTCNSNHGFSTVVAAFWPMSETTSDASAPGRPRNLLRVSGAGKSAQPNGFWRGWHRGDPDGFGSPDHVWNQRSLDEATKVPLVLVPAIRVQPRSALLQQIGSQWDSFDRNRSEQLAKRCERFTRTDRHKDLVTFHGAQVRLNGFSHRPGQVGFMHNLLHHHHPLADRSGSKLGADPRGSEEVLTTSHGQATRKQPSFVLTWISTVPMSVILPTRVPSCTVSPIWNSTCLPPRLSKGSPSRVPVAARYVTAIPVRSYLSGHAICIAGLFWLRSGCAGK